jgi:hypothetical protein
MIKEIKKNENLICTVNYSEDKKSLIIEFSELEKKYLVISTCIAEKINFQGSFNVNIELKGNNLVIKDANKSFVEILIKEIEGEILLSLDL